MSEYYDILGVGKSAAPDEIKKAYRKVAMKFHPDRNPGDASAEAKFKEAAETYTVLSDPDKKARYDQFGKAGVDGGGFQNGGVHFNNMEDIFSSFGDIFGGFGDIFGGGRGRRGQGQQRGSDQKISIPLTLEEIQSGTEKTIKIKRFEPCEDCNSTGSAAGSTPTTCTVCNGTGEVRQVQRSILGQIVNIQPCYQCRGSGKIISNPCRTCSGDGIARKTKSVTIEIPAGVSDGNYMTRQGEGNYGPKGAPPGNLIIYFEEKPHQLFLRDGNDIILDAWIQYPQAVFGATIEVPTLSGRVNLKIPPGIRSGQVLRMRNKGLPELNRHRSGDQLVRIKIETPSKVSGKLKRILGELENELDNKPRFDKFKN
ncbi:MAG: molecular chaperone DnaJ [FCB group bacterium]|nr:molecular chaperone DnaJ [FCB group bacterium]